MSRKKSNNNQKIKYIFYILLTVVLIVVVIGLFIHFLFAPMDDLLRIAVGFVVVVVGIAFMLFTNKHAELSLRFNKWIYPIVIKFPGKPFSHSIFFLFFKKTLYIIYCFLTSLILIAIGILIMLGIINVRV